jgi:flagellar hook-associated protein 3 FlgL
MSIIGIGSRSALVAQSLVDMRRQLDDLQRQLGTGRRAETYADIGLDRGLVVGLRSQLSALGAFDDAITQVGVRLDLAQVTLGRANSAAR